VSDFKEIDNEQVLDIDGDLTFFQAIGLMHHGFFCKPIDGTDIYCIGNHKLCKVLTADDLAEASPNRKIYHSTWKVIGYPGARLNELMHILHSSEIDLTEYDRLDGAATKPMETNNE